MRSIFDQYDAPENRLTHALGCCLERDPRLLRAFIRWSQMAPRIPSGKLQVLEQRIPGESDSRVEDGDGNEIRG